MGLAAPGEALVDQMSQGPANGEASDEALIQQVAKGSTEALALLFRRYARPVHAISQKILRNHAEAEDFLQDIFLSVAREATVFDAAKGSARAWILQMTYRRAISRRRSLASRHFYTRMDLDYAANKLTDPATDPAILNHAIDANRENSRLQQIFQTLTENQRQTLRLFFIEGFTLEEIAAQLGQSRGNVKHHYFRGLERLRTALFGNKLPGERSL